MKHLQSIFWQIVSHPKYRPSNALKAVFLLTYIILNTLSSFAQVGVETDTPDPSSALDVVSSDKGILIPRIMLTADLSSPDPVTLPATGLLIFNDGPNQEMGFYYWAGSTWLAIGSQASIEESWSLTGNAGTSAETNFIGTIDSRDFAVGTNNIERMRVSATGQILIGNTIANSESDYFSVFAKSPYDYGINSYSDYTGIYSEAKRFGMIAFANDSTGFPIYAKNTHSGGYGAVIVGNNGSAYTLIGHSAGLSSHGNDGIFTTGSDISEGIGIIAGGNGVTTLSTISTGTGGAFTGHHGIYAHAIDRDEGTGVIGVGNDESTYIINENGSGGAFSGYHGILGFAKNQISGTGVIGVGNDGGYYLMPNGMGSGGAFTGYYTGVAGWADFIDNTSVGVVGQYNGSGGYRDGIGVKGIAYANTGRGYGVYGQGNRYGVYSNGNFGASGTKSFVIDHPLDPGNKILKHFSIESPEVLNLYRGNIVLDNMGEATITLPDYFMAINTNFSYSLTSIGTISPNLFIKKEIDQNGIFVVGGGLPNQKISWVVYAERNDAFVKAYPESKASEVTKEDDLKGLYIRPELYNQPCEKGIFYSPKSESIVPIKKTESKKNEILKIESVEKNKK